ncbi:MAG: hypothetical protein IJW33_03850 [Lentisphaeria bacterium]|nr:hypothetical protein [Lentisphaeria bacterium]
MADGSRGREKLLFTGKEVLFPKKRPVSIKAGYAVSRKDRISAGIGNGA